MKNVLKKIVFLLFLLIIFVAVFFLKKERQYENVILTILVPDGDSGFLPHLVAQKKNYLNKFGINIIIRKGEKEDPSDILNMSGDIYLAGRSTVYNIASKNKNLIKIKNISAQELNKGNDAFLIKKSSKNQKNPELKTYQIGLFGGGQDSFPFIKYLLRQNNLTTAENFIFVKIRDIKNIDSSILNEMDIVYAREPFLSILLQNEWKILIGGPIFAKNIFSPWPMTMTVFSTEFLNKRPTTAKKVVDAYDMAIRFIRENPEESQKILSEYVKKKYKVKDLHAQTIRYYSSSEIPKELIQKQSDWYFSNGIIEEKVYIQNLFLNIY